MIPFHYARTVVSRLTNADLEPIAKIPELKVCAVKLSNADRSLPAQVRLIRNKQPC